MCLSHLNYQRATRTCQQNKSKSDNHHSTLHFALMINQYLCVFFCSICFLFKKEYNLFVHHDCNDVNGSIRMNLYTSLCLLLREVGKFSLSVSIAENIIFNSNINVQVSNNMLLLHVYSVPFYKKTNHC